MNPISNAKCLPAALATVSLIAATSCTSLPETAAKLDAGPDRPSWPIVDGGSRTDRGATDPAALFARAAANGEQAAAAMIHSDRFMRAWLERRDPNTKLLPTNLRDNWWTPHNTAADLWSFMVLTSYFTAPSIYDNEMVETLAAEQQLTNRSGKLPDWYDWEHGRFNYPTPDITRIVFGASEYAKDGLLPLVELLGPQTPYYTRLVELADGIVDQAPLATAKGKIPSDSREVNGEMLQVLARLYFRTGKQSYLEMIERIVAYELLESPIDREIMLRDHGSEVVAGLVEGYFALKTAGRSTYDYQQALLALLDRILEVGRNEDGIFYNVVDLQTGEIVHGGLVDTWGYIYNGYYLYYLLEGHEPYRAEVQRVLGNLSKYRNYKWEDLGARFGNPPGMSSADGFADSIESALVLVNREPVPAAIEWLDSEMKTMLSMQRTTGIVEGWHADGNFARTAMMYALYKMQGAYPSNWRSDLRLGGVSEGGTLWLRLSAVGPWKGKIYFDHPRYADHFGLPINYPRLNEYPQWYVIDRDRDYDVVVAGETTTVSGSALIDGLDLELTAATLTLDIAVSPAR